MKTLASRTYTLDDTNLFAELNKCLMLASAHESVCIPVQGVPGKRITNDGMGELLANAQRLCVVEVSARLALAPGEKRHHTASFGNESFLVVIPCEVSGIEDAP